MLIPVIQQYIATGYHIIYDFWKAYQSIGKHGYDHKTMYDWKSYKAPYTTHKNNIEMKRGGLKGEIPKNRGHQANCSKRVLELMWQYQNQNDLWNTLINALANV